MSKAAGCDSLTANIANLVLAIVPVAVRRSLADNSQGRAGAIPAEGGSLLKHDPTGRGLTTPAAGVQGVKRRTSGTRPLYPV